MSLPATKILQNLDGSNVVQLIGFRSHNVTDAEMTTLAGSLGSANKGLQVWNTTQEMNFTWNGTVFKSDTPSVEGAVVFKGLIDASEDLAAQVEAVDGYQYVVSVGGTLTLAGVTFSPSAVVTPDDTVLFVSATQAYVSQGNVVDATSTQKGEVRLATDSEAALGTSDTTAVTPAAMASAIIDNGFTRQCEPQVVNVAADTETTITHNLQLKDPKGYVVSIMDSAGNGIYPAHKAVNENEIVIQSLVALTGISVTVIGASSNFTA